jgi:hypothetical protein
MQTPQKWLDVYTQTNGSGWHWNTDEQTLVPRYLHFVFSAVSVSGMLIFMLGMMEKKNDALSSFMKRWGGTWFLAATVIQIGVGLWFYNSIPENMRSIFTADGLPRMLFISSNIIFIIGALCIAIAAFTKNKNTIGWIGIIAMLIGIAEKIINRDQLRQAYLKELNWSFDVLKVSPQHDVIALFIGSLVAGLALLVWVLFKYRKEVRANSPN